MSVESAVQKHSLDEHSEFCDKRHLEFKRQTAFNLDSVFCKLLSARCCSRTEKKRSKISLHKHFKSMSFVIRLNFQLCLRIFIKVRPGIISGLLESYRVTTAHSQNKSALPLLKIVDLYGYLVSYSDR